MKLTFSNFFRSQGGASVLCFLFTFFFVPETKGLSLEQVDILYRKSSILGSNKMRKEILANNTYDDDKEAYKSAKTEAQTEHKEDVKMRDL